MAAGASFEPSEVSRGAAFGDIDNDGDVDVVVTNNNGPARVLLNEIGNRNRWIGLRLVGATVDRDMLVGFIPPWESDSRPNHGVIGEGVGVDADGNVFVAEGPASLRDAGSAFTKHAVAGM